MSDYTPTSEQVAALGEDLQAYLVMDGVYLDHEITRNVARCLLTDPDWAGVVTEEPEWEYGAGYQGDNGRELLWFSMGNGGFAIREAAEKEVDRYADAQIQLCRRRKAGAWVPVES